MAGPNVAPTWGLGVSASTLNPHFLQPFTCASYPRECMRTSVPGVATLVRDPATTAADAEAADAALAASGDGRAFERLYRTHVARIRSLVRRNRSCITRAWLCVGICSKEGREHDNGRLD